MCKIGSVADLLITRTRPGVALVRSVDPFDTLEIHRINRDQWNQTPESSGIYVLYGTPENIPKVYIGISTSNMRNRIRSHHVNPNRNWFGVLFAIPLRALLCPAIEAELIAAVQGADSVDVVVATNSAEELRHRNTDDVHVEPALEKITDGLQLLLGQDIFTPQDEADAASAIDEPLERTTPLAREYRGAAANTRPRTTDDPEDATHAYTGAGVSGWGAFEAPEPDPRFRVFARTSWRRATLDPEATTYPNQIRLSEKQAELIASGVLDEESMTLPSDHVFDNWSRATRILSGKHSYSGGYHWQLIE